jgi:hypothetical protein
MGRVIKGSNHGLFDILEFSYRNRGKLKNTVRVVDIISVALNGYKYRVLPLHKLARFLGLRISPLRSFFYYNTITTPSYNLS